jgi:hypothetical protein
MSFPTYYARRWQALIVLAFSLLVVSVGNTILNVAAFLPARARGRSVSPLEPVASVAS